MSALRGATARIMRWPPLARLLDRLDRWARRHGPAYIVLVLAVVVPLAVNALLLAGYLNAAGRRDALGRELEQAGQTLDEKLKAQQSAPSPTAAPGSMPVVPQDIESADVVDLFLKLAQESAVEVVAVDDRGFATQRVGDQEYRAFRYDVQLRARVSQLVAFLNRLEQSQQTVLGVEKLAANPAAGQNWQITVNVVTYAAAKGS